MNHKAGTSRKGASERPRVLYIVYWGAAEPLGRSLVLPAVKKLADLGVDLTLVTFEKPVDLSTQGEVADILGSLDLRGIRWLPLRYHKRPKMPATAFDFLQGCVRSIISQIGNRPDIIHARTFVGGLMGLAVASVVRSQLIYHNEGFYPDEQVDAGVWELDSAPHRLAKSLERQLYSRADAVIALSHKAKSVIESLPAVRSKGTPVVVAPSCVDLDHFQWNPPGAPDSRDVLRLVYAGSVGGRYGLGRIGRFAAIASREKNLHLRILTRSEPMLVSSMLEASGLSNAAWSIDSVPYRRMPDELASQHVGLHFLPQGLSDHGGSPTKIGEYWAAGLPVVVTPNAGDTDDVIRREKVGVIVESHSDEAYHRAALELLSLLEDPDLASRCRRAAEVHYALAPVCERQFRLYQELASKRGGSSVSVHASELGKS